MGCEQSKPPIQLPESIDPLYKLTSADDSGVKVPLRFTLGKHNKVYQHQTLQTRIESTIVTVEASGKLVLKDNGVVVAVAKKTGGSYRVLKPFPLYDGQCSTNKYKETPLYEYAKVKNRTVWLSRRNGLALKIVNGPKNSFEKSLVEHGTEVASWKCDTRANVNQVLVRAPGHDVGLVICLVILADLIDVEDQMAELQWGA